MVYLLKHIDGIASYIDGHDSQREPVEGRIIDAIVYLFLLWGMFDDFNERLESLCIETPYPDETEKSATPVPEFE